MFQLIHGLHMFRVTARYYFSLYLVSLVSVINLQGLEDLVKPLSDNLNKAISLCACVCVFLDPLDSFGWK